MARHKSSAPRSMQLEFVSHHLISKAPFSQKNTSFAIMMMIAIIVIMMTIIRVDHCCTFLVIRYGVAGRLRTQVESESILCGE